ncbi:P-loop containing nucleoside triphosphate hydrolase protein [Abortiporus biennis]|nr:P-loop containing nucleoside triphosphate hydrolase protein [Abortiporus biennis]
MSDHTVAYPPEQSEHLKGSVLSFRHLNYEVPAKGGFKRLVDDVSVDVRAGEMLAIMGPSGAGKSTLLDLMAFRKPVMEGASVTLNGRIVTPAMMHKISSFVEQDDALLGVLTVRESVTYALRLSLPNLPRAHVSSRVERVLTALGLQSCADQRIGTPIQRGISGGQKRRVTAACSMVTFPRILILDEVTSGLDSTAAREVLSAIRTLAESEGIIVLATIHQPSLSALAQFSKILFLSGGRPCWYGKVDELEPWFERWGFPVDQYSTAVEHAMNFLNNDFAGEGRSSADTEQSTRAPKLKPSANEFRDYYLSTLGVKYDLNHHISPDAEKFQQEREVEEEEGKAGYLATMWWNTLVLSERCLLNYSRNLLAYGVRLGMYAGMGLMLATIWIRLGTSDSKINDRLSVHFYSVAFLAFMSVAGIPTFLEERAVYYRETKNGLYTTLPFILSNTFVNMPFLFICVLLFTLICYWAIGLHTGAVAFWRYLAFLYLAILAAETQVLIIASLIPIFVAALAIGAFMNGFWMSVGGYFIKARSLPRFWYFSFHFMDYQKYAFELLTNSDLRGVTFKCTTIINGQCSCVYPTSTPQACTVSGEDVLNYLDIDGISYGKWAAILVCIIIIYRIVLFISLKVRSH